MINQSHLTNKIDFIFDVSRIFVNKETNAIVVTGNKSKYLIKLN